MSRWFIFWKRRTTAVYAKIALTSHTQPVTHSRRILSAVTDVSHSSFSLFCNPQNTLCPRDWQYFFSTSQEVYKESFHAKLSPQRLRDRGLLLPLDSTLDQTQRRKEMWLDRKAHTVLLPEQTAPATTQGMRYVAIKRHCSRPLGYVSYSLQPPATFLPHMTFLQVILILSLCPGNLSIISVKVRPRILTF